VCGCGCDVSWLFLLLSVLRSPTKEAEHQTPFLVPSAHFDTPPACPPYTNLLSGDDGAEVLEKGGAENGIGLAVVVLLVLALACAFLGEES
jgi:hypothetical protein